MVWARTKLIIMDNLYDPVEDIYIRYSGPTPEKFYKKLLEFMETVFRVPKANIHEIDYTWEKSDGAAKFKVWWRITKDLDIYTYLRYDVKLSGQTEEGHGWVLVELKPQLVTEYPQDTLIQQSIFYEMFRRFWHQVFYHKKRMDYIQMGRDMSAGFEAAVKRYAEELRGEVSGGIPARTGQSFVPIPPPQSTPAETAGAPVVAPAEGGAAGPGTGDAAG